MQDIVQISERFTIAKSVLEADQIWQAAQEG